MIGPPALDLSSWNAMNRFTSYRWPFFIVVVGVLHGEEFLELTKK
jgi:hypothetical protein